MNAMGDMQSKGIMLTLHTTHHAYTSMKCQKNEIHLLFYLHCVRNNFHLLKLTENETVHNNN